MTNCAQIVFFESEKQIVRYNEICSNEPIITSRVLQGSMINDEENNTEVVSMVIFARSTNIYHSQ